MIQHTKKAAGILAIGIFCALQICFASWYLTPTRSGVQVPTQQQKRRLFHQVQNGLAMQLVPVTNISNDFHIPCLVHRTVPNTETVHSLKRKRYKKYYGTWSQLLPPYCHQYLWSNENKDGLVAQVLPEALDDYNWLETKVEQGDLARIVALYHYGGVYADNDVELCKPLHQWNMNEPGIGLIVGIEECKLATAYSQYVMAAAPRHPAIKHVLDLIINNIRTERTTGHSYYEHLEWGQRILSRTGPIAVTKALEEYLSPYNVSLSWLCEMPTPFRVPNSDILILPWASIKSKQCQQSPEYAVIVHHFEMKWVKQHKALERQKRKSAKSLNHQKVPLGGK